MRHAIPIGLAVIALLVLLGAPFLGVRWGLPDDRVLPQLRVGAPGRRPIAQRLRRQLGDRGDRRHSRRRRPGAPDLERYAAEPVAGARRLGGVRADGHVRRRRQRRAAVGGHRRGQGSAFLTVGSTAPLFSDSSEAQLDRLHAVPGPGGRTVEMTGIAQINRDSVAGHHVSGCRWCWG